MPTLPSHPPTRCGSRLFRKEGLHDYDTRSYSESLRTQRVDIGRGLVSTWFDASISNPTGASFVLAEVSFVVSPLKKDTAMTDIVSVPTGELPPGARATLEFPAALINAAWNQANAKFDVRVQNGACHQYRGRGGWMMPQFPVISAPSVAFHQPTSNKLHYRPLRSSGGETWRLQH